MNYIIISLKHGTADRPVFWKADNAGYTEIPWAAGIYTEEEVEADPSYYNGGITTVAVPLTNEVLHSIGFKCSYDEVELMTLHKKTYQRLKEKVKLK